MAVEPIDGSSLPDALVPTNPLSDDAVAEGDNHLRNIKITLVNFYNAWLDYTPGIESRLSALEDAVTSEAVYNAGRLGGELPAFYRNAGNMNAGVLPAARLSGTYGINISGNSETATLADEATHAASADEATLAADSLLLGGKSLAEIEALSGIARGEGDSIAVLTPTPVWTELTSFPVEAGGKIAPLLLRFQLDYMWLTQTFGAEFALYAQPSGKLLTWGISPINGAPDFELKVNHQLTVLTTPLGSSYFRTTLIGELLAFLPSDTTSVSVRVKAQVSLNSNWSFRAFSYSLTRL